METWLETSAALALLVGMNGLSAGTDWHTEISTDPIDDTRSAIALRIERPGPWTRTGRYRLLILFCEEPRPKEKPSLYAVIAWNMSAEDLLNPDANRQDASRTTGMLTRFGDEQARRWTYERVEKGNELFVTFPHDMDRFLKEAKRAAEVALRVEHDVTGTQTTVFDLTGSARVIDAMQSGCELPDQPRTPQTLNARQQEDSTAPPPPPPVRLLPPPSSEPKRKPKPLPVEAAIEPLPVDNQAWIRSSCSRNLGPAFWSRCVRREVEAIRRGMPDISNLAADDQAWLRSSCSRDLGPTFWSRCVRRGVEGVRRIQRQ
ncbi:MAG: hypothetical protein OXJ64_15200 [Boseongicola sp.]|nr:hypothetical protein [Boseongicola sp.]MDE0360598.1 hypothetical protein [Rhodospirillaceae bacterium]